MNALLAQILDRLLTIGLPLLVAMVFHEYAHGWVAHRHGDPTAKLAGRLTLNPIVHIDPVGTILVPLMCMLMPIGFFFGWAKPVPVNPALLRNPRRDMALVAAAGPAMNLLLAVASALLMSVILHLDTDTLLRQDLLGMMLVYLAKIAYFSVLINIVLMVLNLIPIPPLDGGRVLTSLLPLQQALTLSKVEPYGMFILLGLIMMDSRIHVIGTILGGSLDLAKQVLGQITS